MGIELNTIVMMGVNVGMDKADYEEFYDDLDEHSTHKKGDITYVYDGMSGDYFYVGEVLFYSNDPYNGEVFELDMSDIDDIKLNVFNYVKDKFGVNENPKITFINHVY